MLLPAAGAGRGTCAAAAGPWEAQTCQHWHAGCCYQPHLVEWDVGCTGVADSGPGVHGAAVLAAGGGVGGEKEGWREVLIKVGAN